MTSASHNRYRNDPEPSPWIKVMVEVERPAPATLEGLNRGERYRALKQNASEHKVELEQWLESEGLCEKILHISDATTFNILFVHCTPDAAEAIAHAPGVIEVLPTEEIPVEIMAGSGLADSLIVSAAVYA